MKKFAHVGIEPVGDLPATAEILGSVLGGLIFVEDTMGRYCEFPAYVVERDGLRYALLGVPAPENDLREEKTNDFELIVEPSIPQGDGAKTDISDSLISRIEAEGRLKCWSLQ
ncbi:hypothetical protein [Xanthomonas arboricola]|uniref:hypothetical protein n=1 Tax=Xanthomonas arboricola TaxID=56448 RepID=UPI00161773F7|nr:hypothetical protein [Xanthomonas arboricola]MBB4727833.1 hypothetical protein [Xanthomonas arboricola]